MEALGDWLINLGLEIIPYSFGVYFPVRWLEYNRNQGYTRIVKAIWYFALGMTYLIGGIGTGVIVRYICFIEAWDLTFQQLEVRRERKKLKSA